MKKTCIFGQGCLKLIYFMVIVAQLVRAPGCGPGGRGFEPHQSPHYSSNALGLIRQVFRHPGGVEMAVWK